MLDNMEDNILDEKLLKKIEQLKPIVPLTNEFVEHLSGQLKIKAIDLQTKKSKLFYQRWYFWTGAMVPVALVVLMVIANQDGFVYKQLPLINNVVVIEKEDINNALLSKKNEFKIETPVTENFVPMVETNFNSNDNVASAPTLRAMPFIAEEDVAVESPEMNTIQPMVVEPDNSALLFKAEPVNPVSPEVLKQSEVSADKKFVLNNKLPDIADKISVYKISTAIPSTFINNLFDFMNVKRVDGELNGQLVLENDQLFGLKTEVDTEKGYINFVKNEKNWRIRFLKQIMMPKEINENQAEVVANDFVKSLGFELENLSTAQIIKNKTNWQLSYYKKIDNLSIEDITGTRQPFAIIDVDPLLAKVSAAQIYWQNFGLAEYDALTDKTKLEIIISAGGYNLTNSDYVNQSLGEAKMVMLKMDDLLVPSLAFYLGQDNLYVPLVKDLW